MSKVEPKAKPEVRYAPGPEFNKMLKHPTYSKCKKCGKNRVVEEPGMKGTTHCPDCGTWTGLKEWTAKFEAKGEDD